MQGTSKREETPRQGTGRIGHPHILKKKVPESVRGERGRLVLQSIREEVLGYVDEAIAKGISERRTCNYLELNRKTIQN